MRIGLVTPRAAGPDTNPGSELITAGIRWLLRSALRDVEFVEIDMLQPWGDAEYEAARRCDLLALCGNPRFDTGDHQWLYSGLIQAMSECGLPMVDLWAGACVPPGGRVDDLLANPRNRSILGQLAGFQAIVTRDTLAQQCAERAGLRAVQLPCSSWWAAKEYGVEPRRKTRRILVPIRGVDPDIVERLAARREVISLTRDDAQWCEDEGIADTMVYRPDEILTLLAEAEEVVTFRLHVGIPAASLGARVVLAAIDSRAQAGEAFGIPWGDYRLPLPEPAHALEPINPLPALRKVLHAAH